MPNKTYRTVLTHSPSIRLYRELICPEFCPVPYLDIYIYIFIYIFKCIFFKLLFFYHIINIFLFRPVKVLLVNHGRYVICDRWIVFLRLNTTGETWRKWLWSKKKEEKKEEKKERTIHTHKQTMKRHSLNSFEIHVYLSLTRCQYSSSALFCESILSHRSFSLWTICWDLNCTEAFSLRKVSILRSYSCPWKITIEMLTIINDYHRNANIHIRLS